jgi:hypothetical protein
LSEDVAPGNFNSKSDLKSEVRFGSKSRLSGNVRCWGEADIKTLRGAAAVGLGLAAADLMQISLRKKRRC